MRPRRGAPRPQRRRRGRDRARARRPARPTRPGAHRRPRLALADGGPRARRRRDRDQRRLQRQPRLDARRAQGPRRRRPRPRPDARTVAVLGEMRELGESSRDEHDALGRLAVRLDIHQLLVVGEPARPMHLGACLEGSWGEESVFVEDNDARARLAARARGARGRRPAQGLPGSRAGDRRRGPAGRRPRARSPDRRRTPMRAILLAGGPVADPHAARHPGGDPGAGGQGLRPADPRRRPDHPPHQARHAHHGRAGDHPLGGASPTSSRS